MAGDALPEGVTCLVLGRPRACALLRAWALVGGQQGTARGSAVATGTGLPVCSQVWTGSATTSSR